ncbi:MAG: hypothetical protein ACR2PK_05000 [Acidimicrobiales bacterium]
MRVHAVRAGVVALLLSVATMGLGVAPAAADKPKAYDVTVQFPSDDPCRPGEPMMVTLTWSIKEHVHRNNHVLTVKSQGSTDSGFVGGGTETQVTNKRWLIDTVNIKNTNPETGEQMSVKIRLRVDLETGQAVRDEITLRCLGSSAS